ILSYFCYISSSFINIFLLFFFNHTSTTQIYTLSLHDALPIWFIRKYLFSVDHKVIGKQYYGLALLAACIGMVLSWLMRIHLDKKIGSTRLNSSHVAISYAVFCLKKKKK